MVTPTPSAKLKTGHAHFGFVLRAWVGLSTTFWCTRSRTISDFLCVMIHPTRKKDTTTSPAQNRHIPTPSSEFASPRYAQLSIQGHKGLITFGQKPRKRLRHPSRTINFGCEASYRGPRPRSRALAKPARMVSRFTLRLNRPSGIWN